MSKFVLKYLIDNSIMHVIQNILVLIIDYGGDSMLKLTVLRRYSEDGRVVYDTLAWLTFDYENGMLLGNKSICGKVTSVFNTKYSYQKSIIYDLFTSKKSLDEVFDRIREKGLKIGKVNFSKNTDKTEVVILIDETIQ